MANRLTNIQIKNACNGKLFDSQGLQLRKSGETGRWVWRYSHLGKRREMGLGSWPAVSLADARRARDRWASILAGGSDPIAVREAEKEAEKAKRDRFDPTFEEITMIVFEARRAKLRGGGTRGRWLSPFTTHVFPKIGRKRLSEIHKTDIRDALAPIWRTKHPTAEKAIQRIGVVYETAKLMDYDCDPFIVKAARHMLGEVNHQPEHTPATPWQDIPDLYRRLDPGLASGLCLRWMILTVVRSDGCRGARLSEIDGDVWTVPKDRVKGQEGSVEDFRCPLSLPAMDIVEEARRGPGDLLFPGNRGTPITSTAIEQRLNDLGEVGRPHGFRTSFRTWAEESEQPWDAAETALNHKIKSKVERSYARSDLLDRRRVLMNRWAEFVTGESPKVIKLRR